MLPVILYLLIIFLLVYWVENQNPLTPNILIINKNPAEELDAWLKKFSWVNRHELHASVSIPKYKFYTEIIEVLLNLARKIGGTYQSSILFLREGLQVDKQFEKKLKELVLGSWLQMGLIVFLTWAFILGALSMVEVKVSFISLSMIGLWQLFGLLILPLTIKYFRKKLFEDIGRLWKMLYVLQALSNIPLSRSEVFTIAGVTDLKLIKQKNLLHIVDKLRVTCQNALQLGGSYDEEVRSLMDELRFQEKWHFELFEKRLMSVKLGLMGLFFLPSYLAFTFLLIADLMTLM